MNEIEEYDDPKKFAEEVAKENGGSEQHPLTRDGEAAAPSKQKFAAAKSSDKAKPSIHEKVAEKKAERAEKAAVMKETAGKAIDGIEKAAEKIKEIGGK